MEGEPDVIAAIHDGASATESTMFLRVLIALLLAMTFTAGSHHGYHGGSHGHGGHGGGHHGGGHHD